MGPPVTTAQHLAGRRLRAAPAYRLVAHERLEPALQTYFAALTRDPSHYGVLLPVTAEAAEAAEAAGPRPSVKALCCESALLWHSLREPGPLPDYLRRQGDGALAEVVAMILDGILEIEGEDGFVGGPAARAVLASSASPYAYYEDSNSWTTVATAAATDRCAALSQAALRYAQLLPLDHVHPLAMRLYAYNTVPLSPRWGGRWGDAAAIDALLGPARGAFHSHDDPETARYWRSYSHRDPTPHAPAPEGIYKLYVSPHPRALVAALPRIAAAFADLRVGQFKVGIAAAGLLRADKIIAYFPTRDAAFASAERLTRELSGVAAQGVPFSAGLTADGLLSWGIDPPSDTAAEGWHGRESWRLWIVRRLARALLAARDQGLTIEPWHYALERLRLDGVDPATWTPGPAAAAGGAQALQEL